jgi:hypothetical protein
MPGGLEYDCPAISRLFALLLTVQRVYGVWYSSKSSIHEHIIEISLCPSPGLHIREEHASPFLMQ